MVSSAATRSSGSSPHTRGAHDLVEQRLADGGIIPAYAGSTTTARSSCTGRPDHPRIRGEHDQTFFAGGALEGSSPHTRGALVVGVAEVTVVRIIPAYAGSTGVDGVGGHGVPDHPRIRGEHVGYTEHEPGSLGSSPHTRGARFQFDQALVDVGIIPAYAGSTLDPDRSGVGDWDHPRIRGEHTWKSLQYQGSPP